MGAAAGGKQKVFRLICPNWRAWEGFRKNIMSAFVSLAKRPWVFFCGYCGKNHVCSSPPLPPSAGSERRDGRFVLSRVSSAREIRQTRNNRPSGNTFGTQLLGLGNQCFCLRRRPDHGIVDVVLLLLEGTTLVFKLSQDTETFIKQHL